jgi:Spy/CpxP family protein refolding chaperone
MFRQKLLLSALMLVVAGQVHANREIKAATPVVVLMPHVLNNVDLLEITPDQKHRLRTVAQKMNREREDNDTLSVELRRELAELTQSYRPDAKAQADVMALLAKTEQRRVEMSLECADQLREILTEDQWKFMLELAADTY